MSESSYPQVRIDAPRASEISDFNEREIAKREPAVHSELGMLTDQAEDLANVVDALASRLNCVCRQVPEERMLAAAEPGATNVSMVARISGIRSSVGGSTARLRDLLDRLEV